MWVSSEELTSLRTAGSVPKAVACSGSEGGGPQQSDFWVCPEIGYRQPLSKEKLWGRFRSSSCP